MARVLLYTDEPILAKGLASLLSTVADLELVSLCDDRAVLAGLVEASRPDVLLLDLSADVSVAVLADLQKKSAGTRIVLWVRNISTELAYQAMDMGIGGILRKTAAPELLVKCLQKVAQGELWLEKNLMASFLTARTVPLSKRESQLVSLLSQGLKNKEIAATLSISEGTVRVYLSKLFRKVGVKDRFELALYGLKNLNSLGPWQPGGDGKLQDTDLAGRKIPSRARYPRSLVLERLFDKVL